MLQNRVDLDEPTKYDTHWATPGARFCSGIRVSWGWPLFMSDGKVLSQKQVTTRKPHRCQACGSMVAAGAIMERTANTDNGRVKSFYWCACCCAFMNALDPWDIDFGFDMDIWEFDGYEEFRNTFQESARATGQGRGTDGR